MSNNFGQAFNMLISIHSRQITLERRGQQSVSIKAAPSNYFRNGAAPEEIIVEGREFVVSYVSLKESGWVGDIKRGDVIRDTDLGVLQVVEAREMFGFGGSIIGYRIRTN